MNRSIETQKLINEKTIQRYIFEELNYRNEDVMKKFYPSKILQQLGDKKIKVIIPNYPIQIISNDDKIQKPHIADFRIIYNDNTYHNVEVEWITSRFDSHTQMVYDQCYKDNKGFLIVLEDDSNTSSKISYIDSSDVKQISAEEFSYWYAFKAKFIVDETISNYVPHYITRNQKIWLIYLPSSGTNGNNSMKDYLKKGRKKGKWAFTYSNKGKHMKNILNISRGDVVVFVWGLKMLNGTHQRQINFSNDWYITGVDICNIKKGYYCDFNDNTFETDEWISNGDIEEKKYMHYFKFDRNFLYTSIDNGDGIEESKIFYKNTAEGIDDRQEKIESTIEKLAWSLNNQGVPAELTVDEYKAVLMYLGTRR